VRSIKTGYIIFSSPEMAHSPPLAVYSQRKNSLLATMDEDHLLLGDLSESAEPQPTVCTKKKRKVILLDAISSWGQRCPSANQI